MATVLSEYLKRNIPEYFQGDTANSENNLMQYLNASGEFLEGIREAINHLADHRNPYKATNLGLDGAITDFGFTLPANLPATYKKEFLRDVSEIIKRGGTKDWLKMIFKFIGAEVTIQEAWIYDPISVRQGFIRDIDDSSLTRFEMSDIFYQNFLYGGSVNTANGVFFEGYKYEDRALVNKYENVPIYGESYSTAYNKNHCVAKTPYVLVRMNSGLDGLNLQIEDYVDDNNNNYSFSVNEQYQIANELISYFLTNVQRPSTTKIIVVVNDGAIAQTDYMSMTDELTFIQNIQSYLEVLSDSMSITDSSSNKSRVTLSSVIGGLTNIGNREMSTVSAYSVTSDTNNIGTNSKTYNELENWSEYTLNIPYTFNPYYIRVRALTTIMTSNNTGVDLLVFGGNYDKNFNVTETLIETIPDGSNFSYMSSGQYNLFRFQPSGTSSVDNIVVGLVAQSLVRG